MQDRNYKEELECLKKYDVSDEEKIRFIDSLYRLVNHNFNEFIKNGGEDIY